MQLALFWLCAPSVHGGTDCSISSKQYYVTSPQKKKKRKFLYFTYFDFTMNSLYPPKGIEEV